MEIGLQIFSVKEALKNDYIGTLEKLSSIGYKNLEFPVIKTESGMSLGGEFTASELKKQLNRLGLKAITTSTRVNPETDWERVIDINLEIGSPAIVCPSAYFTSKESVLEFCHRFNNYAELCKKHSLELYYHNHFQEFQVFEGHIVMDLMIEHMDKDLVKFEMDTYWSLRGGVNPTEWLRKFGSRCDLIHQKDLPTTAQPVNWFDVFGADEHITVDHLYKTQDPAQFAEVGEGTMDIKAIIDTVREIGAVKYMIVEQDVTSKSEMESVEISYNNISRLLTN